MKRATKIIFLAVTVVSCIIGADAYVRVTDTWVPRPLWYGEDAEETALSPNHNYSATTVYLDGLTYGIQFVRLADLRPALIHPRHKIAIANDEEVMGLAWTSPTELTIYARPETGDGPKPEDCFELHESKCYGVTIRYQPFVDPPEPQTPPQGHQVTTGDRW